MKCITAVVAADRLDAVREALGSAGFEGMTVSEGQGYRRPDGDDDRAPGGATASAAMPTLRIDLVVADSDADRVVGLLVAAVGTGGSGDGTVWIGGVDDLVRVRTGERGAGAV